MPTYVFPLAAHTDADNLPGQTFNYAATFVGIDLTGYTAAMTIDGIAVNLPCAVTVAQIGVNPASTVTLTPQLGATTNTWLPGVYAFRITLTAPDATTSIAAYGNLLELTPRQGTTYGTVGPAGPTGPAGPSTGVSPSTTLTSSFTVPAGGATATATVTSSAFWVANQAVFLETAGDYVVDSIPNATHLVLLNLDTPGSAKPGTVIASGSRVTSNGLPGAGTEITVTTTDVTPTLLEFDLTWIAPLTTWRMSIVIVARAGSVRKSFVLEGLFSKDISGVITQDGPAQAPTSVLPSTGAPAWTGTLAPSSGGTKVGATLTGAVSTNVFWGALAQIIRITGDS